MPPFLHLLLLLPLFLLLPGAAQHLPPHNADLLALLHLRRGISSDPSGLLSSSWDPSSANPSFCPSHWYGVACDPSVTSVVALNLSGVRLSGHLHLDALLPMSSLESLDLSGNNLTGSVPPAIDSLASLQHLDLSGNSFYGPLPRGLMDLWGLRHLNLSRNLFEGGLPRGLWRLRHLQVVDLSGNHLWGDVGVVLSELRAAEVVDLSGNRFYGQLRMPAGYLWSVAGAVRYLNLSHNMLKGEFFAEEAMALFRNLVVLDVSGNGLVGELPQFGFQTNLRLFLGRNNRFSGGLPKALFGVSLPLVDLDLSGNNFTGPITAINSTTLQILNLSSNALSGPLPSTIGNCTILDLSDNMISGNVSVINNWGPMVEFVDLSSNNLSGSLWNSNFSLVALTYINIRNNSLQGVLPTGLGSCRNLYAIDLGMNRLEGPLFPSLFTLPRLAYLNLSGNLLTGNISLQKPLSFHPLVPTTYLQMKSLDLSQNKLSGCLPSDIVALQNLQLLNLQNNSLSGKIPSEIGKLSALKFLDLSSNYFNGIIPDIVLPNLTVFNVSYNNLSGLVPPNLRRFPAACFHPGNVLLVFSNNSHPKAQDSNYAGVVENVEPANARSGIQLALIIGCIGAGLLVFIVVVTVYRMRTQNIREEKSSGGESHGRDLKRGIFSPRIWSNKNNPSTDSLSFSNDLLLESTNGSARGERVSNALACDLSAQKVDEAGSRLTEPGMTEIPVLVTPSNVSGQETSDQSMVLDVQSTVQFPGELFLLDNSVIFTAEDLLKAPAEVLGRSCNGASYKATLNNGHMLTVKWFRVGLAKKKKEFAKEVKKIGTIKHPNIISLRAYYWGPTEKERLIVSDYVNGDSLGEHLYGSASSSVRHPRLSLHQRLNISIDIARCLCFLHLDKGLPHGNLKPTNILLAGLHYTAQLTDYGLHRLMTPNCAAEQMLNLSSLGFGAQELSPASPQAATKPVPTFKADIYAFGVILMELLTGKSAGEILVSNSGPVDLSEWVQICARDGREADCYEKNIPGAEDSQGVMDAILAIALRCILPIDERPSIKAVFDDLCSVTF